MVRCPTCGGEVDWVTVDTAAKLMGVTSGRVRQLILAGRFPGAVKYHPTAAMPPFWKIPVDSITALIKFRREDGA